MAVSSDPTDIDTELMEKRMTALEERVFEDEEQDLDSGNDDVADDMADIFGDSDSE